MDFTDQTIWDNARIYVAQVGLVPATFTSAIRMLKSNHQKNLQDNTAIFSTESKFLTCRLLKSRTLLSPFFFATMTLYEEKLKKANGLSTEQLMRYHLPNDVANIIALTFYFRRIRGRCIPEAWAWLEKLVHEFGDTGILLGRAVPKVGVADGLVVGAMRHLALGLFMAKDNKQFQTYKRHLKTKEVNFDLHEELKIFSCTHVHIASLLLQLVGFGVPYADAFCRGVVATPMENLPEDAARFRLASLYIDSLHDGKVPPAVADEETYSLGESELDRLIDETSRIQKSGSKFSWLAKNKDDISSSLTPQLMLDDVQDGDDDALEDSSATAG